MGLFSKRSNIAPAIIIDGIHLKFVDGAAWQFNYAETEFYHFNTEFKFPGKTVLDKMLADVNALMPEIKNQVNKGLKEWNPNATGEHLQIINNLTDFVTEGIIVVSVSGDASWGDMGVDFEIKDGRIIDEGWGD